MFVTLLVLAAAALQPMHVDVAREAFDLIDKVAFSSRPSVDEWKDFARNIEMSPDGTQWILDRPDGHVVAQCLFAKKWTHCSVSYRPAQQLAVPDALLTYLLTRGAIPTDADRVELRFPDSKTEDGENVSHAVVVTMGGARLIESSTHVRWTLSEP